MNSKKENLLRDFQNAFQRFEDVMQKEKDEYIRDSAIQRFEFTFELMWKTLKAYLEKKGMKVFSPRDALRSAFQMGYLEDNPLWMAMVDTRNATSHVYNEKLAEGVYQDLARYIPLLKGLLEKLAQDI